nr:hypothetical protein [Tanacetum cinerariifolium]
PFYLFLLRAHVMEEETEKKACMRLGSDLRPPIRASTSLKILFEQEDADREQEDAGRDQEHSKQSEKKP